MRYFHDVNSIKKKRLKALIWYKFFFCFCFFINIIETSNHCFLLKNKGNDITGIVQLKVKSLKLHGYIIY
jgi:hypothetical protein